MTNTPKYNLLNGRPTYKPFQYAWAFDAWQRQQQVHWLPEEVPLADDVKDWRQVLTEAERNLITQIFRMFTQQDTEVENAYIDQYMPRFKPTEIRMMLAAFTSMESIHQAAYSYLLDTIGMPETDYAAFLEYEEMSAKHDFLKSFKMTDHFSTALSMAVFAGFTEGLQLFASFAVLLNFPRFNKLKGMGQIVTWSVRDETCMSDDTEVLTATGWKLFKDLDRTEKLAQFSGPDNQISFAYPTHYTAKKYSGEMVHLYRKQGAIDILCTPDHDIVVRYQNPETSANRISKHLASEVPKGVYYALPTAGHTAIGDSQGLSNYERFLIALQADGTLPDTSRYNGLKCGCLPVTFYLRKGRKIDRLDSLLQSLDWDFEKSGQLPCGGFKYRVKVPTQFNITKSFSDWGVDLSGKSHTWFAEFLNELAEWDGHWIKDKTGKSTGRIHYSTVVKENATFVQAVAVLVGWRPKLQESHDDRKETYQTVYRVSMTPSQEWTRLGCLKRERVAYEGMVYCATMPEGTLVTRRNGAVGFVGNCHVESITRLYHTYLQEFGHEIDKPRLNGSIVQACHSVVRNEDAFIDLAFEMGPVEGMSADDVKRYIRFIADRRLTQLGLSPIYDIGKNPLPWIDDMLNAVEHANFFENRSTEYSRASTSGAWDDDTFKARTQPVVYAMTSGCPFCDTVKEMVYELETPVNVLLVDDPAERQALYDAWGLTGEDRTFPKAFRSDGTLLKTSSQILDWLEAEYAP